MTVVSQTCADSARVDSRLRVLVDAKQTDWCFDWRRSDIDVSQLYFPNSLSSPPKLWEWKERKLLCFFVPTARIWTQRIPDLVSILLYLKLSRWEFLYHLLPLDVVFLLLLPFLSVFWRDPVRIASDFRLSSHILAVFSFMGVLWLGSLVFCVFFLIVKWCLLNFIWAMIELSCVILCDSCCFVLWMECFGCFQWELLKLLHFVGLLLLSVLALVKNLWVLLDLSDKFLIVWLGGVQPFT